MNYPEQLTNTYDIYEQIGEGGGGTVYRATHKRLQKTVVLKRITANYANMQEYRTEVDILKNLHHPYLPQVLDFIESPDGIYTVMDFIPGKSFRQMLDEGYSFTEKEVLRYTQQLCEALNYLHSQNPPIVHGDIKPDNIMVTPEGNVCLIDFNISGILEGKGAQAFGYTPGFSSPEQVEGFEAARRRMAGGAAAKTQADVSKTEFLSQQDNDKTVLLPQGDESETMLLSQGDYDRTVLLSQAEQSAQEGKTSKSPSAGAAAMGTGIIIDRRSDIFSLGATLYTLLTGKVLDVRALSVEAPAVSDGFWVILAKALEKDPEKRYQDAGKMLQAVLQVHKKNKRYRQLLRRQQTLAGLLIVFIAACVFLIGEGSRKMKAEQVEVYYDLIAQMEAGTDSGMEKEPFDELYAEAVGMYPEYADAYYEMAYYLFQSGDYAAVIWYIDEVMDTPLAGDDAFWGNLYYLYGECHFRLEDYQTAADCYRTALTYRDDNPSVYRDYAISLVYQNRVGEAAEVLDTAAAAGMEQADIYMVRGEIARMSGNAQEALDCFEGVLEETDDEYLMQRAYVMGSKVYAEMGTADALEQDTVWLQAGIARLPMNSRLLLYERLAQDYITLGELVQENAYYISAVDVFREIKAMNWDTYMTYNNAVILCQRIGDLEQAEQWAQEMLDRYPEHYVTYMRLAYLEVEKQNRLENADRNYAAFDGYYRQAKAFYEQQVSGNVTDAEIQLLDNTWQQVSDGGWLE